MAFKHKDIIGLQDLTGEEIELLLTTAENLKEINDRDIKKVPTLRGKTIVNLFYEASTRTRTSFEIAAKRLSADTINITASTSSTTKGETLSDTALNVLAMKPDIIVMRHAVSGAHHYLAKRVSCSVINAGDGAHEHPSQGLLDMLTIRQKYGKLEGLKVAIVGDITHSRVARSNIYGLTKMGANIFLAGPPTMMPPGVERLGNVTVCNDMSEAMDDADVVMMLRIQLERQGKTLLPTMPASIPATSDSIRKMLKLARRMPWSCIRARSTAAWSCLLCGRRRPVAHPQAGGEWRGGADGDAVSRLRRRTGNGIEIAV